MVTQAPEGEFHDSWTYEPAVPTRAHRPTALWQVADVSALLAGLMALAIACTSPLAWAYRTAGDFLSPSGGELRLMRMEPVHTTSAQDTSDLAEATEMLGHTRAAKQAAEREARDARLRLAAAEGAIQDIRRDLLVAQGARQAADQTLSELREELARERAAKEAAELATKEAMARKPKFWRLKKIERWAW